MIHRTFIIAIVLAAGTVYGWRNYRVAYPDVVRPFVTKPDGTFGVDQTVFERAVVTPYGLDQDGALLSLCVFVDPAHDCPGYLFEAEQWAGLLGAPGFRLLLFVPEQTPAATLKAFQEAYGIDERHLRRYPQDAPLRMYRVNQPLKVVYVHPQGVLFHELGNDAPVAQRRFYARLSAAFRAASDTAGSPSR